MPSSNDFRKLVFMNYNEILAEFDSKNIKTKHVKSITHTDLKKAVQVMQEKHSLCRWQSEKIRKRYYYIQYEGFMWLRDVYFGSYDIKLIERDIKWFEKRIIWYQKQFIKNNISYPELNYRLDAMNKKELSMFFDQSVSTIENGLREYEALCETKDRQYVNGELIINENIVLWLMKNKFKTKYIEILEKYKMELTEIYKSNGGYYDNYFGMN